MAKALSRLERCYMVDQDDYFVVPSFGNDDAVRHIKGNLMNDIGLLTRRDKTGSRTATIGQRGRGFGKWEYEGSLAPSGSLGTEPDFAPLLKALFGQDPTSGPGGLTYSFLDDPIPTFAMALYKTPDTLNQKIGYGCVVQEVTFNIGADVAEFSANGECRFVIESDYFDDASEDELGGLGSFPAEPGAPSTSGGIIPGFTGLISIGGAEIARIRTATIKINNGGAQIKDTFGSYLPDEVEGDTRTVTLAFTMYEDDDAAQQALRVAAITKTPVDADLTVGTVEGSIVQFLLKNVQLASPTSDDSARRFSLSFPESRAYGTDITTLDEVTMIIK